MTDTPAPVAVPQNPQPSLPDAPVASGRGDLPPAPQNGHDPALDVFFKIAAERRARVAEQPLSLPFGNTTIRVHRTMPAGFAFDAAETEVDPRAARRLLRSVVVEEDQPLLDEILLLPPNNEQGIDGRFLIAFLENIAQFYGAVPLDG